MILNKDDTTLQNSSSKWICPICQRSRKRRLQRWSETTVQHPAKIKIWTWGRSNPPELDHPVGYYHGTMYTCSSRRSTCQNCVPSIVWYGFCNLYKRFHREWIKLQTTTKKYYSTFKARKKFYSTQQSPTEGIDEFYNRFKNAKYLATLFNADIVDLTSLLADDQMRNPSTTTEQETAIQK